MSCRGRLLAAMLLTALAAPGCSRTSESAPAIARASRAAEPDAGQLLDEETMAFISRARALHHEANLSEEAGDTRGAAARVERIVRSARPHPKQVVPEVEEVLADAWARLAELDVRLGDPKKAEEAADEGLAHARGPSYFRGHLLEVKGIAAESRSRALADAGDAPGAEKTRAAAMRLLEEAVAVQDQVIAEALDAGSE